MQQSPGQNPDCFGEIRLLSKKYFNRLSYMTRSKILLQIGRKRDWMIVFDVLFVAFFKNRYNVSFFIVIWKYSTFLAIFEYFKRFFHNFAGHFQHANTDPIMTISFIRIESRDDSFNIILHEFNVWSVLGILAEERTLLFSIIEHCFAKKELTNLLSGRIRRVARNVFVI